MCSRTKNSRSILISYTYNEDGTPQAFTVNDEFFYYLTNAMGDVIGFTDANGKLINLQLYDVWGTRMTQWIGKYKYDDHSGWLQARRIANLNPLLYRGYYRDAETEFYYLQSRYYSPTLSRFLNADDPEIALDSKDMTAGMNLFAYCNNDPVNNVDPTGYWVMSFGAELQASAIFGLYGGVSINFDGYGNIVIAYCAGVQFTTNVVASASVFAAVYQRMEKATSIKGWDIQFAVSYSVGVHLSVGGGMSVSLNKNFDGLTNFSYGAGYSLAKVPYISVRGGYTGILCSTSFKTIFGWKTNKTKSYSKKGVKVKVSNGKDCVKIYIYCLKRTVKIYRSGKVNISKKG